MYLSRASLRSQVVAGRSLSSVSKMTLMDTATDYFADLRWRATQAFMSLMTKDEREQLLKRMNAVDASALDADKNQIQEETQKTIAEAVVAARAEEARKLQSKWEMERERLHAEAEQAAYERVEADLRIQRQRAAALEQWKADVARENMGAMMSAQVQEHHPVLGEVVVDFGYKRLHVVSAKTLANIPVWKKQRIYRHDRAKLMAADKIKSSHLGLPGVIALHEDLDGKLSILDGQHRVGMMTILQEMKAELSFDLDRVLVEVFPQSDYETHAQDIFMEINKAEPVKLVDMPGVASGADRKLITEGASRLKESFPDMFKASQQCRPPHLNVDNLRDALFASDVIKRHKLKSPKALEEWMLKQNETLGTQYQNEEHASKVSTAALAKAVKYNFYLGLDSSWLYN